MILKTRGFAFVVILAWWFGQATAEPFTIEELLAIPSVEAIVAGQDGTVAWVELASGLANVHIAKPPYNAPRQVTYYKRHDGMEIKLVGLVPGTDRLIFIRGENGSNPAHLADPPGAHLLVVSLSSGSLERLDSGHGEPLGAAVISPDGERLLAAEGGKVWSWSLSGDEQPELVFETRGAVHGLLFSPDGSRVAFVSDRSVYERGKYAFVGIFEFGEDSVTYMEPGVGIDQNPVWSPDGERIAFIRFGYEPKTWRFSNHREGAPFSIVVADAQSGEGEEIWTSQTGYGSRFNGFSASGYSGVGGRSNLVWLADDTLVFPYEKTGWKLLYALPAEGGDARLLTPGKFEVDGATLSPDRSTIVYWANSEADPHRLDLYRMSVRNGLEPERLARPSTDMRYNAHFASDDVLLYRHADAMVPERLIARTSNGHEIQLSSGPEPGDSVTNKGVPAEIVTFESLDGMAIPAVLYRPAKIGGRGEHRIIVHAHGGSRSKVYPVWRTSFGWEKVLPYYLSQGYFVMSVNYRSGIGYGLDFREPESYGGRGAGDVQDFIAAARYVREHLPEVDPDEMIIYGHSYGGHIVSNTLARTELYALGIDSAGVGDWVVEMETDFDEDLQFNIPQRFELEQLASDSSAISRIDGWGHEPILFLHGDNDDSAAMRQTIELYLALKRRGKTVDALIMPGEHHSIKMYQNQVRYLKKINEFIDNQLGTAAAD